MPDLRFFRLVWLLITHQMIAGPKKPLKRHCPMQFSKSVKIPPTLEISSKKKLPGEKFRQDDTSRWLKRPMDGQSLRGMFSGRLTKCEPGRKTGRCESMEAKYSSVKEVIQPQVPLRLPCYDFTPVIVHSFGGSLPRVGSPTSGAKDFHGVTGGVYKARERIHRGMLIHDY